MLNCQQRFCNQTHKADWIGCNCILTQTHTFLRTAHQRHLLFFLTEGKMKIKVMQEGKCKKDKRYQMMSEVRVFDWRYDNQNSMVMFWCEIEDSPPVGGWAVCRRSALVRLAGFEVARWAATTSHRHHHRAQQRKRRRGEESRGSHAHASISIHGHVSAFSKQAKQYQSIRVAIHCVDLAFISICQIDHPILWLQPSVFSIWPKWSANGHDGHYQTGWTYLDRRYDVTRCIAGEGGWPTQSDRLSLPLSGNGNESQGAPNSHLILYCLEPAILHIQYASTPDCSHNSKT